MRMYIDDIRTPVNEEMLIMRNSRDCIEYMVRYGCPNYISFDHDLGGIDTSMNIVKYMIERDIDEEGAFIPKGFTWNVHSANPVGKANIEGYLISYLTQRSI